MPRKTELKLPAAPSKIPEINDLLQKWKVEYPNQFEGIALDVDYLMSIKSPSVREYKADYISSSDCRNIMNHVEFACFHWLLSYSWIAEIQCFLPYNIEELRGICMVTESKFVTMWMHVLNRKFKFAKHNNEIYIYNKRQWTELKKSQVFVRRGKKAGDESASKRNSKKKAKQHTFDKSPYYSKEKFIEALKADGHFSEVDHEHYYQVILQWTKKKSPSPRSIDWMAQAKSIILNNIATGKSKIRIAKTVKPEMVSKIEKSIKDHAERQAKIKQQYAVTEQ